ncbi:TolC family protein [Dyadobacter fanqingshengii]|uniref:TolC family protein n=1 Tax=Dyadobacter fanqingshengii TaxID=2906443 RepID=A0A9X1T7S8_9BACT|nr:TolC family protein [Dyadobacter fanqingshengii]MCF0038643.1 TolC family protein [Dyadobacter fanqingshengii]MCF2503827.1 TolC family protein [Dyadobacter fanqingshengii]USJ34524.1 TolC family protein [Dyadobacter fanqingshengii]
MKSKWIIAMLAFVATAGPSWAQTRLSLKDCIAYGIKNNGNVKIAQYKESIAVQQGREALAGYLPQVAGNGALDDNIKLQSTVLPGALFGGEDRRVALGTKYSTNVSAQADQVIFDQALLVGIKANKPNLQNAALNAQKTKETIIFNVTDAYYQVFVTSAQIDLLKDNLEKTQQILGTLQLQLDNGVIKKVDFDRTQVSLNNIKSQLTLAESNLILSQNQLKFQMGMPLAEQLELTDNPLNQPFKLVEPEQFDAANLTDFKIQNINMQLQSLEKQRIKAGYLPKLSVYGRYGMQSLGQNLGESWGNWFSFGAIGVKLSIPIFDSFRRDAQYKQADLNLLTQNEQLKLNVQNYELQNHNATTQLQKAKLNLGNDESNVTLAKEVYDVTTLQYREGTVTLSDLLNAETSYKEAQSNYINSMLSYYQAKLGIEQSQGTLNNFYSTLP